MATRASHSSPCFLRVADASAASSASKMISLSTPFSFETASTTIRISLFIIVSSLRAKARDLRGIALWRDSPCSSGASLALPISPNGTSTFSLSTSNVMPASLTAKSVPVKRRRPARGTLNSTNTRSPTKRTKCAGMRNTRSKPGDDTSSVYAVGIGSSTSSSAATSRLARSQSSTLIPSGRSMKRRSTALLRPAAYSSSTSS